MTAVIECCDYGVPQRRSRLVLLASLKGTIQLPQKTHGPNTDNLRYSTVSDWIKDLPRIQAGTTHTSVPNHRAASLSPLNLKRIKATPPGGTRKEWPPELQLACHTNGHKGTYGRVWPPALETTR
ncbi:MAG: DNA cytosine methyltransferase [Acidobacteriota bacterium]